MRSLVNEFRATYDTAIIDAPPVGPVADASILAGHSDKAVFVVKWRDTSCEHHPWRAHPAFRAYRHRPEAQHSLQPSV
ncbi:hypothetical protein LAC81_20555 [Ensifer adhaerens]|nr:hypothetical protein [Ensifer adhaerens]MBZ7925829.1 hypothetical protein [Ensifer adhaerens]UAX95008.1 hypothetical protein LAC78_29235 [Ensifer adhaerens]UAY03101.1 hypothetical protein LAC80_31070 [Ensifer adhaerens]UAY11086.1 hypothetical protein LAC81_20555 [Ensifer adhaerens]